MLQSSRSQFMTILPLFFVLVIETMSFGIIFPVLGPLFLAKTSTIVASDASMLLRQFLYGVTLSIFSLAMLVGAPILGDLSDRWGRRLVIIVALIGSAAALIFDAIAIDINSIWLLIFGRVVGGFFAGSQTIAQAAIADISSEENKAINMSFIIFANCIGFIIGPVFGGYFADNNTFEWSTFATPFYAAGVLTLLSVLMVKYLFLETYDIKTDTTLNWFRGLTIFAEAFAHKRVRSLAVISFFSELGWAIFFLYLVLFLVKQYQFTGVQIGHYMSFYGLIWAISLIGIVRVIVKIMKVETIVWASLLLYATFIFFMMIHNETVLWWIVIPIAIGSALQYSALITVFSNAVHEDSQGWVMGISTAVLALSWGIGGVLAGLIGTINIDLPFIVAGVITFLAAAMMYLYTQRYSM